MASQRGGGLVQRRGHNVRTDENTTNDQPEDLSGYPEDEEEHDSKETRLTLMEEILLLGLKDREVVFISVLNSFNALLISKLLLVR